MVIIYNKGKKKEELQLKKIKHIYQYKDGRFLPDTSQPDVESQFEIISKKYTPHESTRYCNIEIGLNEKAKRCDENGKIIECVRDLPELYNHREECCGCTACYAICPKQAITMRPDEEGFLYPVIDAMKCIRCYCCIGVCPIKKKTQEIKENLDNIDTM